MDNAGQIQYHVLPRRQLVKQVLCGHFHARVEVHLLIRDPQLVDQLLDLRLASQPMLHHRSRIEIGILVIIFILVFQRSLNRLHPQKPYFSVFPLERLRPLNQASFQSYNKPLFDQAIQIRNPLGEIRELVQTHVIHGLLHSSCNRNSQ